MSTFSRTRRRARRAIKRLERRAQDSTFKAGDMWTFTGGTPRKRSGKKVLQNFTVIAG